jgi:hypothetical protein
LVWPEIASSERRDVLEVVLKAVVDFLLGFFDPFFLLTATQALMKAILALIVFGLVVRAIALL